MVQWRVMAGSQSGRCGHCVKGKHDADDERVLRLIDTDARQTCRKNAVQVSWNQSGTAGPPGAPGAGGSLLVNRMF